MGLSLRDPPWFDLLYSDDLAIISLLQAQLLGYMFSSSFCKGRRPIYIEEEGEVRIPIIMEGSPIFKNFLKPLPKERDLWLIKFNHLL